MIERLLVFGASGDLMARYLAPGLAALEATGCLPGGFAVIGSARHDWDADALRTHIAEGLGGDVHEDARRRLLDRIDYVRADVTDPAGVAAVAERGTGPAAAYLALPPTLFAPALRALAAAGLPSGSRVALEKPFGRDLDSARELNRLVHDCFPEEAIFRIDSFLGLQSARHLLALRFANRLYEPVWSADHIERIDIVWDETLALEGRAGYYDGTGALRDLVQNHLLQLLCLTAMEPPATLDERDVRDRKVELLRAIRTLSPEEAAERGVRGRYTAGRVGDREVPSYVGEDGVDPSAGTETFAQVELAIATPRWEGVPMTLRTGKALGADRREIVVAFRPPSHPLLDGGDGPAALRLGLRPAEVTLDVQVDGGGRKPALAPGALASALPQPVLPEYGRTLLALLEGDLSLSVRDDEAEASWQVVQPFLDAWEARLSPLRDYPAGSSGPV